MNAAQQLIPVFTGNINNESILLCNARELYVKLKVGRQFATWITGRIAEYGFIENQDYICVSQIRETQRRDGQRGTAKSKDYHLTLDMAKELAMIENNGIGRQIRRYFIRCEKQLKQMVGLTTPEERHPLRDAVSFLVGKKGLMFDEAYKLIHQRFNVTHIDQLDHSQIPQAVEYVHKLALEGELLPPEPKVTITFQMPELKIPELENRVGRSGWLTFKELFNMSQHHTAPVGVLLHSMKEQGYNVTPALVEYLGWRHIAEIQHNRIKNILDETSLTLRNGLALTFD